MDFYADLGAIFNPNNNPFFTANKRDDNNIEDAVIIEEITTNTNDNE